MSVKYVKHALTAFLIFLPLTVAAQQMPTQQPRPQQPTARAANVSKTEVHEYAKVYVKVQKIRSDYSHRLQAVKDAKKQTVIQNKAMRKMNNAVEESQLGAQRYREISIAAEHDIQLRKQLIAAITKLEAGKS